MLFFLDTADVESIRRAADTGMLDGVTTNPTKIAQSGRPFREVVQEICRIVSGPVSVEAVARTSEELLSRAREIASLAPNVVVKIPMTVEGIRTARELEARQDIRVNLTMVFSATQATLAMKAGCTFVSIVLSRLDAVAGDSDTLVADAVAIRNRYGFRSKILGGSIKTQSQVLSCLRRGADIVTIPQELFFQLYRHPLTDIGLQEFDEAWKRVPQ